MEKVKKKNRFVVIQFLNAKLLLTIFGKFCQLRSNLIYLVAIISTLEHTSLDVADESADEIKFYICYSSFFFKTHFIILDFDYLLMIQ